MNKAKSTLIILLAFVQIFLLVSCDGVYTVSMTDGFNNFTEEPQNTSITTDTGKVQAPETVPYPLTENMFFTEEIISLCPESLTKEEESAITAELEAVLSKKDYSEAAKELVRDTFNAVMDGQKEFQALFGFLKPCGTAEYLRKYIIGPLDTMVNTLRFCGEKSPEDLEWLYDNYGDDPGFSGLTMDDKKTIVIIDNNVQDMNICALAHELHHAAVLQKHNISSSLIYNDLLEGEATLGQLSLIGSYYQSILDLMNGSVLYKDPENEDRYIELHGNGGAYYSIWSNKYFKLLALTDFETMDHFMLPAGETEIRKNLVKRYGSEGGLFYDSLQSAKEFDEVVENEARFLNLLYSRTNEITSAYDYAAYINLYRLYRRVFCARYIEQITIESNGTYESRTNEFTHPKLNYREYDTALAEQALKWEVFDGEHLTDNMKQVLAYSLIANLTPLNYIEYREYFLSREGFTVFSSYYTLEYEENGDIHINIYFPEEKIVHYVIYSIEGKYTYQRV